MVQTSSACTPAPTLVLAAHPDVQGRESQSGDVGGQGVECQREERVVVHGVHGGQGHPTPLTHLLTHLFAARREERKKTFTVTHTRGFYLYHTVGDGR